MTRPSWRTVSGIVIATFLVVVISLNFVGGEKHVLATPTHAYGIRDDAFERVVGSLLGPPIVSGNRVDTLVDGDEIFPSMLEAIHEARHTIDFETYIYWSGRPAARLHARSPSARRRAWRRTC